jgi:hypothetical protein
MVIVDTPYLTVIMALYESTYLTGSMASFKSLYNGFLEPSYMTGIMDM